MDVGTQNNHLRSRNGWYSPIPELVSSHKSMVLQGWVVLHDKEDGTTDVIEPTFATKVKLAKDNLCHYAEWMKWGKNNWSYWENQKYHVVKATLTIEGEERSP